MITTPAEEFLTVEEAAVRLKVEDETIRRWLRSGQLRGLKFGRVWRIPASALLNGAATANSTSNGATPTA